MSSRTRFILLAAILLVGAFARLHHLTQQSLWLDEGYTHHVLTRLGPTAAAADDMHPPLYYFLLDGWMGLVGDSVLAMRALSALLSIMAVPIVYRLARRLAPPDAPTSREATALTAALLFALSDPDIFLAQEIRMYALFTLTVTLSVWLYLRWAKQPTHWRAFWWLLSTTAMIYTIYTGALIMIAEGLHALLFLRDKRRLYAIGLLALSAVLFLPWFSGPFLEQLRDPNPLFLPWPLNADTLHQLLTQYFSQQWALIIGLALMGLVTVHCTGDNRFSIRRPGNRAVLVGVWLALPFAVIFLINLFTPFVSPRWPLLITPALAILVARGLGNLRHPARGILLAAILVYGVTTVDFYRPKPPWNQVAENALRYARAGDVILMEVGNGDFPLGYYLEHNAPENVAIRSLRMWREGSDPAAYPVEVIQLLETHPTVWLAAWGEDHAIFGQLETTDHVRTVTTTIEHAGNALNVYRYDRLPEEPVAAFTSGMILRSAAVYPDEGRVDLLWSAPEALTTDYTVSAFVLNDAGQLVAQDDSYPFHDARPTTSWQPGEVVYDPRSLGFDALPPGCYTVGVKVYTWYDGTVFPTTNGENWAVIAQLER